MMTGSLRADAGPLPSAFVAVTVNWNDWPFATPVIVADVLVVSNASSGWAMPPRYGVTT